MHPLKLPRDVVYIETSTSLGSLQKFEGAAGEFKGALRFACLLCVTSLFDSSIAYKITPSAGVLKMSPNTIMYTSMSILHPFMEELCHNPSGFSNWNLANPSRVSNCHIVSHHVPVCGRVFKTRDKQNQSITLKLGILLDRMVFYIYSNVLFMHIWIICRTEDAVLQDRLFVLQDTPHPFSYQKWSFWDATGLNPV